MKTERKKEFYTDFVAFIAAVTKKRSENGPDTGLAWTLAIYANFGPESRAARKIIWSRKPSAFVRDKTKHAIRLTRGMLDSGFQAGFQRMAGEGYEHSRKHTKRIEDARKIFDELQKDNPITNSDAQEIIEDLFDQLVNDEVIDF